MTSTVEGAVTAEGDDGHADAFGLSWSDRSVQIGAIVIASAIVATFGPAAPTGLLVVDVVYRAVFGGVVAYAGSRAARWTWVIIAAVSLAVAYEWWQVPATVALLLAVRAVFQHHTSRRMGALVATLSVQVILYWGAFGFHGGPTLLAIAATVPLLVSAYHRAPGPVRRRARVSALVVVGAALVLGLPFVLSVLLARGSVEDGVASARAAFGVGQSTSADPAADLEDASRSIERARTLVGGPWTLGARLVPGLAQQQAALAYATDVAGDLTKRTSDSVDAPPSAERPGATGQIDLEQLDAVASGSSRLDRALAGLAPRFRDERLQSGWLAGPTRTLVDDLRGSLHGGDAYVESTIRAARALPALLGADGPRRYLVVLIDPATSRGLGGVARAYAHVSLDQGKVTLDDSGQIGELTGGEAVTLVGPSGYVERYGPYNPAKHLGDITYSPDLGQVAGALGQLDATVTAERPLDGVVVMDPTALRTLLSTTDANGGVDVGRLRQPGSDEGRDARFARVLQATLDKVLSSPLPDAIALNRTIAPLADAGRLAMYSRHPQDRAYLDATGLSRRLMPGRNGDLIGVTSQSARADGLDRYMRRRTLVTTNPSPSGWTLSEVTVTLDNTAPKGTSRQWVTLYSPGDLLGVKSGSTYLPVRAVPEAGVMAFSTFVDVPPGASRSLTFGLMTRLDPSTRYDVHVFDQPGDARSVTKVTVGTPFPSTVRARVGAKASGKESVATVTDGGQTDITVRYRHMGGRG